MQVSFNPILSEIRLEIDVHGKDKAQMLNIALRIYRMLHRQDPIALTMCEESFSGRDIMQYFKLNNSGWIRCSVSDLEDTDQNLTSLINLDVEKLFFYIKIVSVTPHLGIAHQSIVRIQ